MIELKRPSVVLGKSKTHPKVLKINRLIETNFHKRYWHFADEENFLDLKTRARKVIELIESSSHRNNLTVSHGYFLGMILATMMMGKDLTSEEFLKWISFIKSQNTGVTMCQKDPAGKWRLIVWNDHSHLG